MKRFLLCLATLGVVSAAQAVTFSSAADGYTITTPPGWTQKEMTGVSSLFMAPQAQVLPGFWPNVNVVVQKLPSGMTLKQYHDLSLSQLDEAITDAKLLSTRQTTLAGVPAYEVTMQGRQGKATLFFLITYGINKGKAYVVTGTTVMGKQSALLPSIKQINAGFKISR